MRRVRCDRCGELRGERWARPIVDDGKVIGWLCRGCDPWRRP